MNKGRGCPDNLVSSPYTPFDYPYTPSQNWGNRWLKKGGCKDSQKRYRGMKRRCMGIRAY